MLVENVDRKAALLDNEPRLRALTGEPGLDHCLVGGGWLHCEHNVVWGFTDVDASGALPRAGEARLHHAPDSQVALRLGDPAREPAGLSDR